MSKFTTDYIEVSCDDSDKEYWWRKFWWRKLNTEKFFRKNIRVF